MHRRVIYIPRAENDNGSCFCTRFHFPPDKVIAHPFFQRAISQGRVAEEQVLSKFLKLNRTMHSVADVGSTCCLVVVSSLFAIAISIPAAYTLYWVWIFVIRLDEYYNDKGNGVAHNVAGGRGNVTHNATVRDNSVGILHYSSRSIKPQRPPPPQFDNLPTPYLSPSASPEVSPYFLRSQHILGKFGGGCKYGWGNLGRCTYGKSDSEGPVDWFATSPQRGVAYVFATLILCLGLYLCYERMRGRYYCSLYYSCTSSEARLSRRIQRLFSEWKESGILADDVMYYPPRCKNDNDGSAAARRRRRHRRRLPSRVHSYLVLRLGNEPMVEAKTTVSVEASMEVEVMTSVEVEAAAVEIVVDPNHLHPLPVTELII